MQFCPLARPESVAKRRFHCRALVRDTRCFSLADAREECSPWLFVPRSVHIRSTALPASTCVAEEVRLYR